MYTLDEVAFVQNLVFYIEESYRIPVCLIPIPQAQDWIVPVTYAPPSSLSTLLYLHTLTSYTLTSSTLTSSPTLTPSSHPHPPPSHSTLTSHHPHTTLTPSHPKDYGIWERGDKINHGETELNATSIGMAKVRGGEVKILVFADNATLLSGG